MTIVESDSTRRNGAKQCIRVGAAKEGAPPRTQDDITEKDFENTSKKPGSLTNLIGSALLARWKSLCAARGRRLSQLATA